MKTRLLSLFVLLSITFVGKAQYVTIPDTAFVAWLNLNGYSTCLNANQMDTTCSAIVNAWNVTINNTNIIDLEGIQYFDNLFEFTCKNSQVNHVPAFRETTYRINVSNNQLVSLPPLPGILGSLVCYGNDLTSLPPLPPNLLYLESQDNKLTSINLPARILTVHLDRNLLTACPVLPDSIHVLTMEANNMTGIPHIPIELRRLSLFDNNISVLPALPLHLEHLNVTLNNLQSLPALPSTIRWLSCNSNNLTSIPAVPDTLIWLYCHNNPNLTCLPKINIVGSLDFINTGINCLPNYPNATYSNPPLSTLPLCTPFNSNRCQVFANLSGLAFIDTITDCAFNSGETGHRNIKTSLYNNGVLQQQTLTGNEGLYSFDAGYGNYELRIDTSNTPFTAVCPGGISKLDTINAADSTALNINFALRCKTGFDLAAYSVGGPGSLRPARVSTINIQAGDLANFFNSRCAYGVSGVVTAIINGPAKYVSPGLNATAPTSVNSDTLKWNVADFGTINAATDFNIQVATDTSAPIGSAICITLKVTANGDINLTNNETTHCFNVVNSFDPNDKQVSPPGDIDTLQKWLTYTVRFQNTGTAEAQHIYIMDTLDANIDGSSFQLLAYSHQPQVLINENIVRFNFANINLPDSNTNEPESHGYIQYKVKLKNNLPVGTTISNTAFIYFDFNAPVVTNTTTSTIAVKQDTTTVGIPSVTNPVQFTLYPNPTQQQFTVTTTQPNQTLQFFDIEGRVVFTQNINGTATTINISNMASGVYVVGLSNTNVRKRLIKL
jgi:uncharacterized repeat protein (TIGR01451 family)